jgi:hypothetical protein
MRVITAFLGIGLFIAGCGSSQVDVPVQHLNFSLAMDGTDFARAQSSFRATDKSLDVANTRVTLENLNFQTPRTIERDNVSPNTATPAPTDVVQAQAVSAAQQLFPDLTLTVLSVDSTPNFHYVTFQQTFENREIVGAKLVLRLLPSGEWVTANSNLVAAQLLASLKNLQALSTQSISSKDFFPQVHQVLKQKSVIYPRSGDNGSLEVFAAREFIVYDLSNHLEFFFWIDEQTNQVVGAFQPTAHVESMRIKGTILPNEPADQAQEVFFPFVSILAEGGKKSQTDGDGRIGVLSALAGKVQVKL